MLSQRKYEDKIVEAVANKSISKITLKKTQKLVKKRLLGFEI